MVTIPRAMLFKSSLRPGDFVEWVLEDEVTFTLRPFKTSENVTPKSPGIIAPDPATGPR